MVPLCRRVNLMMWGWLLQCSGQNNFIAKQIQILWNFIIIWVEMNLKRIFKSFCPLSRTLLEDSCPPGSTPGLRRRVWICLKWRDLFLHNVRPELTLSSSSSSSPVDLHGRLSPVQNLETNFLFATVVIGSNIGDLERDEICYWQAQFQAKSKSQI